MIPSANDMRRVSECDRKVHNPAFDQVVMKAAKTVREAAKRKFGAVAYKVPDYVQGFPVYKMAACTEYVRTIFESKGFDVYLEAANIVVIRWRQVSTTAVGVPSIITPAEDSRIDDGFSHLTL
jgi:hypothetical protein